jgi:hypothetical protein
VAEAGLHEKGQVAASVSGSLSFTENYDRKSEQTVEYTGDELLDTGESEGEDYSDIDASVALSLGYFVADGLELGMTGSAMGTWYSNTDLQGFEIYDIRVHSKYFFDNKSSLTPYVKLSGGPYWLETGTYKERDWTAALALGLEFYSFGPVSWYAELSSEYKDLSGSISGTEWETRLYLGVSFYSNILKERPEATLAPSQGVDAEEKWSDLLREVDERVEADLEGGEESSN